MFSRPWKKGNPDNFAGTEHCAEFVDSELNDVNCNSPVNYICEKKKCKSLQKPSQYSLNTSLFIIYKWLNYKWIIA